LRCSKGPSSRGVGVRVSRVVVADGAASGEVDEVGLDATADVGAVVV
jgi:hypothetical protein